MREVASVPFFAHALRPFAPGAAVPLGRAPQPAVKPVLAFPPAAARPPLPRGRAPHPAVKPVLAFPPAAPYLIGGRDRSWTSGRVGMGMAYLPAAQRALDVITPVVIYRQIGRRPSQVYVNDAMGDATPDKAAQHRLSDRVYWKTEAKPGEQIQDRRGGVLLVNAAGECYPIALAEPTPLTPAETPFSHADLAIKADQAEAERLIAAGHLVEATPKRPKHPPSRPPDRLFADDHPVVVEKLPKGAK